MNPYQVLGILPHSSLTQIKAAYRCAAASHHPDRGGSHEEMVTINAAYEQLTRDLTTPTSSEYPHQKSAPSTPATLTQWLALYHNLLQVVERRGYKRGWIMYRLIELKPPLEVWQLHGQMMGYQPSFALYHWQRQEQEHGYQQSRSP